MSAELPVPTDDNLRRWVMGDEVSSGYLLEVAASDEAKPYHALVSSPPTRAIWDRRTIPLRDACLVNLAILAGLNRPRELLTRTVGLLRGGISVEEIQEVFMHVGFYGGNPAGIEATVALYEATRSLRERGIPFRTEPYVSAAADGDA
jgi:alkylhydroperoxidase/carboxymuconolactone decarboxylase family protein YurZ